MRYVTAFFRFWHDSIISDDWTVAAAVVAARIITALVAGLASIWVIVLVFVGVSLWKASQS